MFENGRILVGNQVSISGHELHGLTTSSDQCSHNRAEVKRVFSNGTAGYAQCLGCLYVSLIVVGGPTEVRYTSS